MVDTNELRLAASYVERNEAYRLRYMPDLMREAADEIDRLRIPPDGVIADIRRRLNTTGGDASDVRRENSE